MAVDRAWSGLGVHTQVLKAVQGVDGAKGEKEGGWAGGPGPEPRPRLAVPMPPYSRSGRILNPKPSLRSTSQVEREGLFDLTVG